MKSIQLEERHFRIVNDIFKKYEVKAYVFGSRARNTAKPLSDLDLCLKDDYDKSTVRKLQDAFEESDLPFKVDIVIWSEISESFIKHIEKDLINFEKQN
jgi:predicted nucleotidyltransferase